MAKPLWRLTTFLWEKLLPRKNSYRISPCHCVVLLGINVMVKDSCHCQWTIYFLDEPISATMKMGEVSHLWGNALCHLSRLPKRYEYDAYTP